MRKHGKKALDLATLHAQLRNPDSWQHALFMLRTQKHADDILRALTYLDKDLSIKAKLYGTLFPKTPTELALPVTALLNRSAEKELLWQAVIFKKFKPQLEEFVRLKTQFEDFFLRGNHEKANGTLAKIQERFGFSFWLIENKIGLLQEWQGTDAQLKYANDIQQDLKSIPAVLVFFLSLRAEKKFPIPAFEKELEAFFKDNDSPEFESYFKFRLLYQRHFRAQDFAIILACEWDFSLIDRYQAFTRVCQSACATYENQPFVAAVSKALQALGPVKDPAIHNLRNICAFKDDLYPVEPSDLVTTLDFYTVGNYEECIRRASIFAENEASCVEFAELIARSAVRGNLSSDLAHSNTPLGKLISNLIGIFSRSEKIDECQSDLLKMVSVYQSHAWALRVAEHLEEPSIEKRKSYLSRLALLAGSPVNPALAKVIESKSIARFFLSQISAKVPGAIVVDLFLRQLQFLTPQQIATLESKLAPPRRDFYKAIEFFEAGNLTNAEAIFATLSKSEDMLLVQEALVHYFACILSRGDYLLAIKEFVFAFLRNSALVDPLPAPTIFTELKANFENKTNVIEVPIFISYIAGRARDLEFLRVVHVEAFLEANGFSKPSDLLDKRSRYPTTYLIYFMREVCGLNVIDSLSSIQSSEEVEKERIAICQFLAVEDPARASVYNEEIKSLSQKIYLRQGLREIAKSKIFVEVDGIKRTLRQGLKEKYDRYQDLPEISSGTDGIVTRVNIQHGGEVIKVVLVRSEKRSLLRKMLVEIRDSFLSSSDHGLDGYLSMHIRHGILANQIRKPLESSEIICQKDDAGVYRTAQRWSSLVEQDEGRKLEAALIRFSEQIDSLIECANRVWVQVNVDGSKPGAFFDFSQFEVVIQRFISSVGPTLSYEDFISGVFQELWRITDDCLDGARHKMQGEFKDKLNEAFDELIGSIAKLEEPQKFGEITNRITIGRAKTLEQADVISDWFQRSQDTIIGPYELTVAIEVCVEQQKNLDPTFHFRPKIEGDCKAQFISKTFPRIVSIFSILFDNANRYCGLAGGAQISISHTLKDGVLKLRVANELAPGVRESLDARRKLDQIRAGMKAPIERKKISLEGGTGISKIRKMLEVDMACESKIDFGFADGKDEFFVDIEANVSKVII